MRYDIAPIHSRYRGMERTVVITDLWNAKTKKIFKTLLEKYYLYLGCIEEMDCDSFEKTLAFYKELQIYGIPCEMIAYADAPLEKVFDYSIDLLGIDIVHDMCESLLSDEINPRIMHLLNENGLCNTEADVEKIIPFQDHGNVEWTPCYVYKIDVLMDRKTYMGKTER